MLCASLKISHPHPSPFFVLDFRNYGDCCGTENPSLMKRGVNIRLVNVHGNTFFVYFVTNEAITYTDQHSKEESLFARKIKNTVVYKQEYGVRK